MDIDPLVVVGKSILDGASPQTEQVLGNTAESVIMAVFGNRAAKWRMENLASESQKCISILRKRGFTNTEQLRELLPKFGLLFVEQASLEDNETLQDVWANLLANAVDPQRDFSEFRCDFMDVIRGLSPIDVQLLKFLFLDAEDYRKNRYSPPLYPKVQHLNELDFYLKDAARFSIYSVQPAMSISTYDYIIASQNLLRLQIASYYEEPTWFTPHFKQKLTYYEKDLCFTAFGYLFAKNCLS